MPVNEKELKVKVTTEEQNSSAWRDLSRQAVDLKNKLAELDKQGQVGSAQWNQYQKELRNVVETKERLNKSFAKTSQQLLNTAKNLTVIGLGIKETISGFEDLTKSLKDSNASVGDVAMNVVKLGSTMLGLLPAIQALSLSFKAMWASALAPITLVLAGITAVSSQFILLYNNIINIRNYLDAWTRVFKGENIFNVWFEVMQRVLSSFPIFGSQLADTFSGLKEFFISTLGLIRETLSAIDFFGVNQNAIGQIDNAINKLKELKALETQGSQKSSSGILLGDPEANSGKSSTGKTSTGKTSSNKIEETKETVQDVINAITLEMNKRLPIDIPNFIDNKFVEEVKKNVDEMGISLQIFEEQQQAIADKRMEDLQKKYEFEKQLADNIKQIYDDLANNVVGAMSSLFGALVPEQGESSPFKNFMKDIVTTFLTSIQAMILGANAALLAKGITTFGISLIADAPLLAAAWVALEAAKGFVGGFAEGGMINGKGTGTSDSNWAKVSDGEYIIRESSVKKFGQPFFDWLNGGGQSKGFAYATGGAVGKSVGMPSIYISSDAQAFLKVTKATNNRIQQTNKWKRF